jgi:hypothetical protein
MTLFEQTGGHAVSIVQRRPALTSLASSHPSAAAFREATHSRTLDELGRALQDSDSLAPSDIFRACCDSLAPAVDLMTAVLVEQYNGPPRSIAWKPDEVEWNDLAAAEEHAWGTFLSRVADDSGDVPAPALPLGWSRGRGHWRVLPLAAPVIGIVQLSTYRSLALGDLALLQYVVMRLSLALYRRQQRSERP